MTFDLKQRLNIGFVAGIFLVLLVGTISYKTFETQSEEAEQVTHSYQVINSLVVIEKVLIDMETGRRGFRSTNDKQFLQPYEDGAEKVHVYLLSLDDLVEENIQQKQKIQIVKIKINHLIKFWESLGEDASGYTREKIIAIMTAEKNKVDEIRNNISNLIKQENELLAQREIANKKLVTQSKWALVIGIFFILIIVILLINQILKEFNNRRKAEKNLKQNYKQVTVLNQENAERNWQLAGLVKVNEILQGDYNSLQLSQVVLNTVVKYLDLKAGAFYIFNKEQKKLFLTASSALSGNTRKEYNLNEGFVGQAALEKEPVVISDIPANYATIEGATINVTPVQAIYAPLYRDKELKGLIEVLSFGPINDKRVKFLKTILNSISVALHSAQDREKVLQLLEKVQHQKEELENQQEELRQTNEELTVQAEVLQASEEELRVQEEELRQINAEIHEKNKVVEAAGEELKIKARELEATSKYKSEFLANMSHELRTPLNSVLILAKLLANNKENTLTEKQINHAKIIHKSGSDLLELINDILDLSKIEAGKVDLFVEEVKVKSIAINMEQLFTVVAEEKNIQFTSLIQPDVPELIKTDKQKVEQILKNLLSNAFKFTPKDGKVQLVFEAAPGNKTEYLSISVKDTGIGIPAAKQKDIFEAFHQADGSTNRKFGGTGLGLSITKELLRIIGGKVEVESEEGKGSTFRITIPVETIQGREQVKTIPKEQDIFKKVESTEEQTVLPDERQSLTKDDKVMLIIEDDQRFASIIQDFAINNGYKTVIALNGNEGLLCSRKYKPSAIILDIQLPGIDGQTLLKLFKSDPELKNIPVHIISGSEDVKLSQSGALAFLKKPFEKDDLERAFGVIGEYLQSAVKRVMIISNNNLKDDVLQMLLKHKNTTVFCDTSPNIAEAMEKLVKVKYDCIIADIGSNINEGISQLNKLHEQLAPNHIPTIIYLDKDITSNNELELKKIGDVIVRKSSFSNNRLLDELELFLYKVEENGKTREFKYPVINTANDAILKEKSVLLVDDDMRNIFALSAALEQEGMKIVIANDGKEALDVLKENKNIDVVLMDVMMPEMDGYEAMHNIRHKLRLKTLPIIALTAKAMSGDREKCIEAGASDYITKPVDTQKLISLLRVWLA